METPKEVITGIITGKLTPNETNGWFGLEPSPIEFMHATLQDEFHKFRKSKTENVIVEIDGMQFNHIVVEAKKATYEKYKALGLNKAVLKSILQINNEIGD
jgi:hypothetical protein